MLCVVLSGMKQSGASLGDVVLPLWAKGDAREFIRAHREVRYTDTHKLFTGSQIQIIIICRVEMIDWH